MKTIKSLKEITTLEVGDKVIFGDLEYKVSKIIYGYYLSLQNGNEHESNDKILNTLNISKRDFVKNLGIDILPNGGSFPEVKSLEALTAIVSALFKEYEKKDELPKTWEEFCMKRPIRDGECYIDRRSHIEVLYDDTERDDALDRNVCISKQEAKAFLALMQLRQLRKAYVKDWEPDWKSEDSKYCIEVNDNELLVYSWHHKSHILSFPSSKLAKQFLTNFKDLLEIAKPLL